VGAAGTGSTVFAGAGVLAERFAGSGGIVRDRGQTPRHLRRNETATWMRGV
jgi:hypothetical protein